MSNSCESMDDRLWSYLITKRADLLPYLQGLKDDFEIPSDFCSELYSKIKLDFQDEIPVVPLSLKIAISQGLILYRPLDAVSERGDEFLTYFESKYPSTIPIMGLRDNFLAKLFATDDLLYAAYDFDKDSQDQVRIFKMIFNLTHVSQVPIAPLTYKTLLNLCQSYLEDEEKYPEYRLYRQIVSSKTFREICELSFSSEKTFRLNAYLCAFIQKKYELNDFKIDQTFYESSFEPFVLNADQKSIAEFIATNRSFIYVDNQKALERSRDRRIS